MSYTHSEWSATEARLRKEYTDLGLPEANVTAIVAGVRERLGVVDDPPARRMASLRSSPTGLDGSFIIARRTAIRVAHPEFSLSKATATAVEQLLEEGEPILLTLSEEAILPDSVKRLYREQFEGDAEYNDEAEVEKTLMQRIIDNDPLTPEEVEQMAPGLTDEDLQRTGGVDTARVAATVAERSLRAAAKAMRDDQLRHLQKRGFDAEEAAANTPSLDTYADILRTRQDTSEVQRARDAFKNVTRSDMGLPELDVEV